MAKGSDNPFPSVLLMESSAPPSPVAGNQRLFIDPVDHKLKRVTSGGSVTVIESSGGGGSAAFAWATKTAAYAITTAESGLLVDTSGGALTLTLPTAVGAAQRYAVKKKDSSAHAVTIATTGSQTIDGFSGVTLSAQNASVEVESDGANWYVVGSPATTPAVRAYNSAAQAIPNTTFTTLTLDSTRFDQGATTGQHSTTTNTSRLTCQVAGIYQITGTVSLAAAAGSERIARLLLNGATLIGIQVVYPLSVDATAMQVTTLYALAVGDYIELQTWQNSGGAINSTPFANGVPELMWVKVA